MTYAQNLYDATLHRSFQYDAVGRLYASHTGEQARVAIGELQGPGAPNGPYAHEYDYDTWGNITARRGWGGWNPSYTYSFTNNRRVGTQYDAAGNPVWDGSSYTYDATGQQILNNNYPPEWQGYTLEQGYDGDRLRVKRTERGVATYYVRSSVLGGQAVAEINSSGAWTRGFVYHDGGALVALQQPQEPSVEWVHTDPVAKSQRLTNQLGMVVAAIEVDPWGGETTRMVNPTRQARRFTTYERDGNGRDQAMHRSYHGWWTRFDQPDPFDGSYDLTNPQSLNRYAYVQNDPVNFTDPSGLNMSGCSAEYSYAQCGGDDGFWGGASGGGFGGHIAEDNQHYGGLPSNVRAGLQLHEQRISNSQAGYGFLTNAQANAALAITFSIYYTLFSDGSYSTWFDMGRIDVAGSLRWDQRGAFGEIGDFARGFANTLTFGFVDYVDRNVHGMDDVERARLANSSAHQLGEGSGAVASALVPIPAAPVVRALGSARVLLNPGVGRGVAVGTGGRSGALRLFNELRGTNGATRVGPGIYTAPSATGHGTVTFRFPSASRSNMWTVDTPHYGGGIRRIHF